MVVADDLCPFPSHFAMRKRTVTQELSDMTAIKTEDVISTLQALELIQYRKVNGFAALNSLQTILR